MRFLFNSFHSISFWCVHSYIVVCALCALCACAYFSCLLLSHSSTSVCKRKYDLYTLFVDVDASIYLFIYTAICVVYIATLSDRVEFCIQTDTHGEHYRCCCVFFFISVSTHGMHAYLPCSCATHDSVCPVLSVIALSHEIVLRFTHFCMLPGLSLQCARLVCMLHAFPWYTYTMDINMHEAQANTCIQIHTSHAYT